MSINKKSLGFSLIELSIVLVIIGLVAGGVLVGQDLINSAAIRTQISQIEKYQTAVHAFQAKYEYLPGDIPAPYATYFGFNARGNCFGDVNCIGEGDGNGILEDSNWNNSAVTQGYGAYGLAGELVLFWSDLSKAGLISEGFSLAQANRGFYSNQLLSTLGGIISENTSPSVKDLFPYAKIGYGYIVVQSGGIEYSGSWKKPSNGINYFSTFSMDYWNNKYNGVPNNRTNMGGNIFTPQQAYSIDAKIDDGLPQYGNVTAMTGNVWASNFVNDPNIYGDSEANGNPVSAGDCIITAAQPYNCYNNGGVSGVEKYSLNTSNINCALSFKFQ